MENYKHNDLISYYRNGSWLRGRLVGFTGNRVKILLFDGNSYIKDKENGERKIFHVNVVDIRKQNNMEKISFNVVQSF